MAKCVFLIRKNTFIERAQEEWKNDIVYDPKGHNDLEVCSELLNDFRGRDPKVMLTFVVSLAK